MSGIRSFLDFWGNMGLLARGDRPKVVDLTGRVWGPMAAGFSLSARQERKQDSEELPTLSVVLRNGSGAPLAISANGWLAYYELSLTGPDGAAVPLSPFGAQFLKATAGKEILQTTLEPGAVTEAILPIGSIYAMRGRHEYKITVSCRLPDGAVLTSNEAVITP